MMGIRSTTTRILCEHEKDSVGYMLFLFNKSTQLWSDVENWIIYLGFADYKITNVKILLGELENPRVSLALSCLQKKAYTIQ